MRKTLFVILSLLMLLVVACDKIGFPIDPIKNLGQIMIIHASPDADDADVYLRDQLFAKKLSYPNASPYTSLKEGDCTVSFRAVGGSDVLLETDVNVKAGQFYSVFACDQVANLTALVVQDVFPDLDQNDALVRVAHLSPDAPAVDVFLNDVKVATSAEFKDVTDFQQIEDDTYTLQVKLAGTSDVVLEIEDLNLRPRVAYTLWVRGFVNGDPGEELDAGLLYNRIIL